MPLFHRVRQSLAALTSCPDEACERLIDSHLTPAQAYAFRRLSPHDRAHLCRVCARILHERSADCDLIIAALLHDIGKVSDRSHVRLVDRVAKVLLVKFAPSLLNRLAKRPAPRLLEGLSLAVHHPEIGAARAAKLGCSARVCWLIAHHEDQPPIEDEALCLLVAADRETV